MFTISQFLALYPDDSACLDAIKNLRFPEGIICARCNRKTTHHRIKTRPAYACARCGTQISPLAGTIFHRSSTPLRLWFYAMYLMTQTKSGLPAGELQRQLGVTYKTAWRMMHQIRKLMDEEVDLTGTVEVDETFVGGRIDNMHRSKLKRVAYPTKAPVMGFVQRGGKAKLIHVENIRKNVLTSHINQNLDKSVRVMTDSHAGYLDLHKHGYRHEVINHALGWYADGDIYTQNVENLWSHLKRGLTGVYRGVSKKHLQQYCNEFGYRYNHRSDENMFDSLLKRVPLVIK
jgi:transposase